LNNSNIYTNKFFLTSLPTDHVSADTGVLIGNIGAPRKVMLGRRLMIFKFFCRKIWSVFSDFWEKFFFNYRYLR
jgi:hypothetical protein